MQNFTPVSALIGGGMIGLAAVLLMWLNGRVAGISGIAGGLVSARGGDIGWRLAFILGLLGGAALVMAAGEGPERIEITPSLPLLIAGGLLVGFGTRYGSGCTSGHGVCGIARLSPRSILATLLFMITAFVVVFIRRHVMGA